MLRLAFLGDLDEASRYRVHWQATGALRIVGHADAERMANHLTERPTAAAPTLHHLLQHQDSFDGVLLHQPLGDLFECLESLVDAGKHCLIDVRLLDHLATLNRCRRLAESSSACLTIGHQLLSSASIRAIQSAVESGNLGQPGLIRLHSWQSSETPPSHRIGLSEVVSVANRWAGALPDRIFSVGGSAGERVTDYRQLHFGYEGGAMALVDWSATLPQGDSYFSASVIGSDGAAYADDHHNHQLRFLGGTAESPRSRPTLDAVSTLLDDFERDIGQTDQREATWRILQDALTVSDVAQSSLESRRSAVRRENGSYELT